MAFGDWISSLLFRNGKAPETVTAEPGQVIEHDYPRTRLFAHEQALMRDQHRYQQLQAQQATQYQAQQQRGIFMPPAALSGQKNTPPVPFPPPAEVKKLMEDTKGTDAPEPAVKEPEFEEVKREDGSTVLRLKK